MKKRNKIWKGSCIKTKKNIFLSIKQLKWIAKKWNEQQQKRERKKQTTNWIRNHFYRGYGYEQSLVRI